MVVAPSCRVVGRAGFSRVPRHGPARQERPLDSTSVSSAPSGGATGAVRKIAFLGNHAPRQCGIATFTTDLADAIALELPESDGIVVAMNDVGRHHLYPPRVRFELPENELAAYRRAAGFLNLSAADVLCVQHEYGIFGGPAG